MFYGHTFTKNQNVYLNMMRDLARYNSKNYEVTTRDGHVKGLMVNLRNYSCRWRRSDTSGRCKINSLWRTKFMENEKFF